MAKELKEKLTHSWWQTFTTTADIRVLVAMEINRNPNVEDGTCATKIFRIS
jgi:hypothetical protein